MSRRPLLLAALAMALAAVTLPAQAQLGGLARKARQKVNETTGTQSVDQPARLAGPEVTNESVGRLLVGLKAEAQAREQRAAAEQRRQQQEAAARDVSSRQDQCYRDAQEKDPARPELERLQAQGKEAADKGDYTKAGQIAQRMQVLATEMQARIQAACAAPAQPTPAQQAIQQATGSPEDAGAAASGLSATDYAQLKELIYTYLVAGNRAGLADSEKQAVEQKKPELRERLKAVGLG